MEDSFLLTTNSGTIVLTVLIIWSAVWKGIALWKAGRNNNIAWFVVIFVFNTVGILEILYIYLFSKKEKIK